MRATRLFTATLAALVVSSCVTPYVERISPGLDAVILSLQPNRYDGVHFTPEGPPGDYSSIALLDAFAWPEVTISDYAGNRYVKSSGIVDVEGALRQLAAAAKAQGATHVVNLRIHRETVQLGGEINGYRISGFAIRVQSP